ncbi:MAG: sarcosine oxidase subunit delta [Pseudomonadota bacterium]
MRIDCPVCGPRDLREFTPKGAACYATRPEGEEWSEAWHEHLHLRENPAGRSEELWYHGAGCSAWLIVERDTRTHEIFSVRRADGGAA